MAVPKDQVYVRIEEDKMIAYLYLAVTADISVYKAEEIYAYAQSEGIIQGISLNTIQQMINQAQFGQEVVIARGSAASDGVDGHYQFEFNTKPDNKVVLLSDGSVDYKNLGHIQNVEEDELIATYIPKKDGIRGYTVTGEDLMPRAAKDLPRLRGKGFHVSEDGLYYYANFKGKATYSETERKLTVTNTHYVSGDVDLSTGNIEFNGDVEVSGSLRAGMQIIAAGNVTINGLVEAAYIESQKDILVRRGILGGGKAYLTAGGSVQAQFIERAQILAEENISSNSVLDSTLIAGKDIEITGRKGSVVGGKLKASRKIMLYNVGSLAQVHTELQVGVDDYVNAALQKANDTIAEEQVELQKIEEAIEMLKTKNINGGETIMQKLMRAKIQMNASIARNQEKQKDILNKIQLAKEAEVQVEGNIYPGTYLRIDYAKETVAEMYQMLRFVRRADKVLSIKM